MWGRPFDEITEYETLKFLNFTTFWNVILESSQCYVVSISILLLLKLTRCVCITVWILKSQIHTGKGYERTNAAQEQLLKFFKVHIGHIESLEFWKTADSYNKCFPKIINNCFVSPRFVSSVLIKEFWKSSKCLNS